MQGRSLGRRGTQLFWRFYWRGGGRRTKRSSQIVHAQRFGQFGVQQRQTSDLKKAQSYILLGWLFTGNFHFPGMEFPKSHCPLLSIMNSWEFSIRIFPHFLSVKSKRAKVRGRKIQKTSVKMRNKKTSQNFTVTQEISPETNPSFQMTKPKVYLVCKIRD